MLAWARSLAPDDAGISSVTVGELQAGIEHLRHRDDRRHAELEAWLESLLTKTIVLPTDAACFRCWGRLMRGRSRDIMEDAMIAATALVHDLVVVTRNTKDFVDFGVAFHDPFVPR